MLDLMPGTHLHFKSQKSRRTTWVPKPKKEARCSYCGSLLARHTWNQKGDLLCCHNYQCHKYRQPQGWIEVDNSLLFILVEETRQRKRIEH